MILRHCERARDFSENPPLTTNGKKNSLNLVSTLQKLQMSTQLRVVHSPKIRCYQTVENLLLSMNVPGEPSRMLDEQHSNESTSEFRRRIHDFYEAAPQISENLVACSHHEWISLFFEILKAQTESLSLQEISIPAGGFFIFSVSQGLWTLKKEGVL